MKRSFLNSGEVPMTYDELCKQLEQLSYRDKFRLAELLIQLARKEEEEAHPERRQSTAATTDLDLQYVAARVRKSKPSTKEAVLNVISAMFQFKGGISDSDKQRVFSELHKARHFTIGDNGRILYS